MTLLATALRGGYGSVEVLHGVDLEVLPGEIVGLFGPNAAGKTTLLRWLSGLLPKAAGELRLGKCRIDGVPPFERVHHGLVQVPEGRALFRGLTVAEHLALCHIPQRYGRALTPTDELYDLFPVLRSRTRQRAETLSGGEQQMLAIARAMRFNPTVLLLDEPTSGLAPLLVDKVLEAVTRAARAGVGVLLVEQHVRAALQVATKIIVLNAGAVILDGVRDDLSLEDIQRAYLRVPD